MRTIPVRAVVLAVISLLVLQAAFGQAITGTISGKVTDPSGSAVPGASVKAKDTATGAETKASTDAEGLYRIANLVSGEYVIEVESQGFRKSSISPQRLSAIDALRIDVSLEVGQLTEVINVEATATAVNTEDAQLGKVLREVGTLPLLSGADGRNVLALAGIQPGVVFAGQLSGQAGGIFSANGQRAQANNYMFDGGDSNDLAINVPDSVHVVSPNAVTEFRLVTGAMKAEYGRNSGAIVMVTPRSGGNSFHGGAHETFRNTKLNAVPYFQKSTAGGTPERFASGLPRKPQWNSNDFDAQLGGPVVREKSFFFLSYLGFRRRQGVSASAVVFNDAQRALIQQSGTPEARAIMALVPPASTGNTLFSSPSNSKTRDQGLAKWDHYFTEANRFSASYFIENQVFTDPFAFGSGTVPGFGTSGKLKFQNLVLRDTHTFSGSLFNEFRASFHRRGTLSVLPLNSTKLSSLGLGAIISDDASAEGPPSVQIIGFTTFGNSIQGPQGRADNTFHYLDNMSWTRGRQFMKFGGEFRTFAQNQVFDFINNGLIFIDGSGTTSNPPLVPRVIAGLPATLNDFATNFATQFVQNSAGRRGYRTRSLNLFWQDDWKVRPNFALNFGVRWEYNNGLKDIRDRVVTLRRGQKSTVFQDAPTGMVYPGDSGISRSTYGEDLNNFAPRIGFAWDLLSNGKLSLRGGYGFFYDAPISELTLQFLTSAPYAQQPFTLFTNYNNPWAGSRINPIPQPFPFTPVARGGRFNFANIAPIPLTVMDPDFATPYAQQWNLQIQYQMGRDWLMDAGYVGSTGVKLLNRRQANPAIPGPGATTGNTNARRVLNLTHPERAQFNNTPFGGITNQLTDANSNYNSLQLGLTKRFSHGFQMTHAYTWGHTIDNASGLRVGSRIDSARADRGNSEQDVRHRYVMSAIHELPFMKDQKGAVGRIIGGWGAAVVTTFQTGLVFNITEGTDRCLCTSGNQRPDYLGGEIRFFDPRSTSAVTGRANSWFDGTGGGSVNAATNPAFRRVGNGTTFEQGAGRFGNFGRNVFHGPGLNNWEISFFKNILISEGHKVQFRGELFNMFNHTQFLNPNGDIGSANFGLVTLTQEPRIAQFVLKYTF